MDDDMKTTINHDEIQKWAELHHGKPEIVDDPSAGSDLAFLRINFHGGEDDIFLGEADEEKKLSWKEFFKKFDELNLAFMYDPKGKGEDMSMFYKFIKRNESGI